MAAVLAMTHRLEAELPAMLAEHAQIVRALDKLRAAAKAAGCAEHRRIAEALVLHAQSEESVLNPAALRVGERVAQALARTR